MQKIQNKRSAYLIFIYFSCFAVVQVIDASCDEITSGRFVVRRFGDGCKYMCHCVNNTQCDDITGSCTLGCNGGWFGPGCQYRNPAFKSYCRHTNNTDPPYFCGLGTDSNETTCSKAVTATSNRKQPPWWRVWFPNEEYISELTIITASDSLYQFLEFDVFVESVNETQRDDIFFIPEGRTLCYKHGTEAPVSTDIHIVCSTPAVGNQVRIQLSSPDKQLVLCEVKINGGRNLAFLGDVNMTSVQGTSPLSNTVDGIPAYNGWDSCAATYWIDNRTDQWWTIDFGHLVRMNVINISAVNDDRLKDYQIVVLNSTEESTTIYNDTGHWPPVKTVGLNGIVAEG